MSLSLRIFPDSVSFFDLAEFRIDGFDAIVTPGHTYKPCDIAVVYGLPSLTRKGAQKNFRTTVYQQHRGPLVVVESSLIGRVFTPRKANLFSWLRSRPRRPKQSHHYLRLAVGGALGDDADFHNGGSPPDRWERLQAELGLELKPYRTDGRHVLVIGQVENDASLRGVEMVSWLPDTVRALRRKTDRPIRIRMHPSMRWNHRNAVIKAVADVAGVDISPIERPIADDLHDAWCCVTLSSGAAIDALLDGIPPICLSPASLAYKIASNDLADVEHPAEPPRQQWLNDLCYGQWTLDEFRDGTAWRHIEPAVRQRL